jgi:hypothetical protein
LSDEETITGDDKDTDIKLASSFRDISIKSKSSKISWPEMTPTKNVMFNSGASSGQSTTDTMLISMEDHTASSNDGNPAVDVLDFQRQWGTQTCLPIILARPSHPEHNSPFISMPSQGLSITITNTMGSISGSPLPCPA